MIEVNLWSDAVERQLRDYSIDHAVSFYSAGTCVAILVKAVEDRAALAQPVQPAMQREISELRLEIEECEKAYELLFTAYDKVQTALAQQIAKTNEPVTQPRTYEQIDADLNGLGITNVWFDRKDVIRAIAAISTKDAA